MLNLLISIIGQSYERINSTAVLATFKERADLISDSTYLVCAPFSWFNRGNENDSSCLMIVNDVTQEGQQSPDDLISSELS